MIDRKYGQVTLEKKDAPENEPCFVLRGQDILAAIAVRKYADLVEAAIGGNVGKTQSANIRSRADEMAAWPAKKLPDGV